MYFRGERLGSKNACIVVLDLIPQDPLEIHYLTGGYMKNVGSMGRDTRPSHDLLLWGGGLIHFTGLEFLGFPGMPNIFSGEYPFGKMYVQGVG